MPLCQQRWLACWFLDLDEEIEMLYIVGFSGLTGDELIPLRLVSDFLVILSLVHRPASR